MADIKSTVRHLIEALRGGGYSRFEGGKLVEHAYGPSEKYLANRGKSPIQMRQPRMNPAYRLYADEATAMGEQPLSYDEWNKAR